MFATVINWFEERLKLGETLGPSMTHSVPMSARWWYVFGSMTLTIFMLQIATGICLSLVYVPSADEAYASLGKPISFLPTMTNDLGAIGVNDNGIHFIEDGLIFRPTIDDGSMNI